MPKLLNPYDGRDDPAEDPATDLAFYELLARKDARAGRRPDPELHRLAEQARSRAEALAALGREEAPD